MKHILYQTGDNDAPKSIKDSNDEVVLNMCKLCGKAESELVNEECEHNLFINDTDEGSW